jgi:hypothetical protein
MIYVKSVLTGLGMLTGCVGLFTFGLFATGIDLRAIMGHFPLISLAAMLAVFTAGFLLRFRAGARKGFQGPGRKSA